MSCLKPNGFAKAMLSRSFYTYNVPKTGARQIELQDGSKLIFRNPVSKRESLQQSEQDESEEDTILPPKVRTFPKRSVLTPDQISEMRRLREKDPDTWTISQLCKRFNTFPGFVMRVTQCPVDRKNMLDAKRQAEFDDMEVKHKLRAINRIRRKDLW